MYNSVTHCRNFKRLCEFECKAVKVTLKSKEESSSGFWLDVVQEFGLWHRLRVQIQKEVISDFKDKNQFLSKEIWENIRFISRETEREKYICKPV